MVKKLAIVSCLAGALIVMLPEAAPAGMSRASLEARGIDLPLPWGVGLTFYNQRQDYTLKSLEVGIPGFDSALGQGLPVTNNTENYHLKLDYWVTPYLDLFAIVGQVKGSTEVRTSGLDLGVPLGNIKVPTDGTHYGGGLTLAGGWDKWFATLTGNYIATQLDVSTSSVEAYVVTPKVGVHTKAAAFWIGLMYQRVEEKHEGIFEIPFLGAVPFKVTLGESEPLNFVAGASAGIGEHWHLIFEGGVGDRDSAMMAVEYRW